MSGVLSKTVMTQPLRSGRTRRLAALALGLCLSAVPLASCKKGSPPSIVDPGNQVAVVNQTLTIDLFASDPDGDGLEYDFRASGVEDLDSTTSLTVAPDGHGVFTFTPVASQVGTHIFDFIVSDGTYDTTLSLSIEVRGAAGAGSAPIFRKPLSGGVILELEKSDCVDFEILVEDPDSTQVQLTQLAPVIKGSQLDAASNGLEGTWTWCPDREQRDQAGQQSMTLSADDGDNPPTLKDFIVLVRPGTGENCPGEAPAIEHEPGDFSTLLDLPIEARVTDDQGLKNPPLVLYAFEDPREGGEVRFDRLEVAEMELVEGDMRDGRWRGFVPNPTATQGEGTEATLYYIVEALDNDDAEGDCDHLTDSPPDGVHEVSVVNSGEGTAGVCQACSTDIQCGGPLDLCIGIGGNSFCSQSCTDTSDCPDGYNCSPDPISSVDGQAERQCTPDSGSCSGGGGGGSCEDDVFEDDDNPQQAIEAGFVEPGDYTAKLCPNDEDWWLVRLTEASTIIALLEGDSPPDMDLVLVNADQESIDTSATQSSTELIEGTCLAPGDYFVVVEMFSVGAQPGDYSISFDIDASDCQAQSLCCNQADTPGCADDPAIESCVCDLDSVCCSNQWDSVCVSEAMLACSLECEPDDSQGDCCSANGTAGCQHDSIQQCACLFNGECCNDATWTQGCVDTVNSFCGGC